MIALADMSAQAVRELQAGRLTDKTRATGGDLVARLCVLQGEIGEREFVAVVRRCTARDGAPLGAAALDEIIAVVGEVASAVRAMN